ncbi:MAG TPA: hypothetical protein VGS08_05490 [Candidatus Saccharimonadales bacterium]|nr:hypothetical protein [Candidatus Saccharimonadales bacterium]
MKTLNIRQVLIDHWENITFFGFLFIVIASFLSFRLNSLLPGFSSSEIAAYQGSNSLNYIFHHPVNAPFSVLGWLIVRSHLAHSLLYFRLLSAGLALVVIAIFCGILYYWHGLRTALLGTLLFGFSSWVLHTARLGTADILQFGFFALIACGIWLQATASRLAIISVLVLGAMLLYVPGMIWLIAVGMIVSWRFLDNYFTRRLGAVTIGTILALGIIAPLAWAIYQTPSIAKVLLNFPNGSWPMPIATIHNFIDVPVRLFIYGQANPVIWLDHLAVLSVFGSVMFILGGYAYLRHFGLKRTKLLLILLIACCAVIALGGSTSLTLIVPFIYLVVAAGIDYMLRQWLLVFPRNPVARTIGVGSMIVVLVLAVTYQTKQYFVAWPQVPSTRSAFAQLSPVISATISGVKGE